MKIPKKWFYCVIIVGVFAIWYDNGNNITAFQIFSVLTLATLAEWVAELDSDKK